MGVRGTLAHVSALRQGGCSDCKRKTHKRNLMLRNAAFGRPSAEKLLTGRGLKAHTSAGKFGNPNGCDRWKGHGSSYGQGPEVLLHRLQDQILYNEVMNKSDP